ncbi:MAG TPA: tetratricopeptide repeat protein [Lentimicrobium sp.]|nr:tetratricopeptide repeat protein [Lentimicrobium sp.]
MTVRLLAVIIAMAYTTNSFAQTKDDAVNAYNKAVSLATSDLPGAVNAMKESADIAAKVGPEADTIGQMAQQQIATLQYNYATALYKEKKIDEAISNFMLARDYAVQYKDAPTKAKTDDLLPKLYLSKGVNEYKNNQFDAAVASYSKALEFDSTFARAYLNMGLAYKKLNKDAEKRLAFDNAIKHGLTTNDEKTVEAARKSMSDDLLVSANTAFKKNDFNSTVSLLDEALKYNESNPEIYYLQAVALNKTSKFDLAQASAEKGLTVETDTPEKKARFYFEIGNALAGKGDTANACASYKKAAIGPFAESANYQIKTVLKCM